MAGLLIFLGYAIFFIGWVWMIVTAIQTGKDTADKVIWAIVCAIACAPIGPIIFYVVKKQGMTPLLVQIVGVVISIIAVVVGGGQASFNLGN